MQIGIALVLRYAAKKEIHWSHAVTVIKFFTGESPALSANVSISAVEEAITAREFRQYYLHALALEFHCHPRVIRYNLVQAVKLLLGTGVRA